MTIPYQQQAYGSSTGTSPIPSYYFRDHDPTSSNTAPVYQLYSVWVNTVTKGIWYLESFTSSAGVVSSVWRAVAPIVVSSTGPASPLTSSSDYSYPIGQTWVDSTANDYYVMVSNPTDTTGYWIKLSAGTQGVDLFAMQTGSTPIGPDASGIVTFSGATVAAGTNPVRTDGTGANTMTLEVQLSQAIAATDATKVGLSNFNSAQFTVDANGFVSLAGGGAAIDSFQPDTGTNPVVPNGAGLVKVLGQSTPNVSGIRVIGGTNELDLEMFSPFEGGSVSPGTGNFSFVNTVINTPLTLSANNTGTGAASHAIINSVVTPGATGGSAKVRITQSGFDDFSWNVPSTNSLYLTNENTSATLWKMVNSGARTMPLQPSFMAYQSANVTNATGDGTDYTVIFDTATFDQGTNYNNATGIFTAPIAGKYRFSCAVFCAAIGAGHTQGYVNLNNVTTGAVYRFGQCSPAAIRDSNNSAEFGGSIIVSAAASDAFSVSIVVANSTKTITIAGSGIIQTFFSGELVC